MELTSKQPKKGFSLTSVGVQKYLTGNEFKIYACLAGFCDKDKNSCYPSRTLIKELTGVSKSSISKITKSLEKKGFIKILKKYNSSNLYFVFHPKENLKKAVEQSAKHVSKPVVAHKETKDTKDTGGAENTYIPIAVPEDTSMDFI